MEECTTAMLELVSSILSPLQLHLDVTKDTLYMGINQQLVKHQKDGVTKHQHVDVMHFTQRLHLLQQSSKSSVNYTEYNL